jgi:osmoprotectant transport system permease protein
MTSFTDLGSWLTTGSNWTGPGGIGHRLWEHLGYSLEALVIAVAIGLSLGLLTGHTRRFGSVLSSFSNGGRALPTLGLLTLFAIIIGVGLSAALIPLVILAIPPILVNTDAGIRGVDRTLTDAARGMGLRPHQVLFRVEMPVALPLIVLGLRTATLQIISTATIAAFVGLGGLGRFIIDGEASRDYAKLGGGAVVVAMFAILTEAMFLVAQRLIISPGLRSSSRASRDV